ncbi:hypothetical protein H1R20_g13762, partial [Candolleomyces eurysporus]
MPVIAPVLENLPPLPQPDWSLAKRAPAYRTYQQLKQENEELRTSLERAAVINRAQDAVIEGAHATMVVQNLHLMKLNGALHGKEKERTSNRTLVIDSSKGQVYSTTEVLEGLRLAATKKQDEAEQKRLRADARAAKRDAQAKVDGEWARIKDQHEKNTADWKVACENCQRDGIPRKEWPNKPTRPRKPTLPANFAAVGDDEDVEGEENVLEMD